ncbi:MAG: hypothetical protein ACSLFK_02465, partial [Gemmatimonadaceae bacterium]
VLAARTSGANYPPSPSLRFTRLNPPMPQPEVRHLVSVWNPSYGTDVMESHIKLLNGYAQQFRRMVKHARVRVQ